MVFVDCVDYFVFGILVEVGVVVGVFVCMLD